jgi:tryptophanyl-tRNA synthetase
MSHQTIQRVLKAHHFYLYEMHLVQDLQSDNNDHQVKLCEWILSEETPKAWVERLTKTKKKSSNLDDLIVFSIENLLNTTLKFLVHQPALCKKKL